MLKIRFNIRLSHLVLKIFLVSSKNGCTFAPDLREKSAGVLAQVARAFDWQSKGHEFDSHILHEEEP